MNCGERESWSNRRPSIVHQICHNRRRSITSLNLPSPASNSRTCPHHLNIPFSSISPSGSETMSLDALKILFHISRRRRQRLIAMRYLSNRHHKQIQMRCPPFPLEHYNILSSLRLRQLKSKINPRIKYIK